MRTMIQGGWVVGHRNGSHYILRNGQCVIEGDKIIHIGRAYQGELKKTVNARNRLITPGLISTHLHAGNNTSNHLYLDNGRPEAIGRNYLNWQARRRDGVREDPNRLSALFGLAQCMRSGVTTAVEIGCGGVSPEIFVGAVDELGVRVYTGPSYRNALVYSANDGRLEYDWDQERGGRGLEVAVQFVRDFDGAAGGRLRAILCPGHTDTCDPRVLVQTAEYAAELRVPITIHSAINPHETLRVLDTHRLSPVELLAKQGLLGPQVILGHCVFISGHSWLPYSQSRDLELLGENGATVSHAPYKYMQMGACLESVASYISAGVNVTIGTDITPSDIVKEMRLAMLGSRISDRSFLSSTPRDVFDAATVNAANALGRSDLGRLEPGAKADIAIFNLDKLNFGFVHDPIRALVEAGSGADLEALLVDGRFVMADGRLLLIDEDEILACTQAEGRSMLNAIPNWLWGQRSADEAVPLAYTIEGDGT